MAELIRVALLLLVALTFTATEARGFSKLPHAAFLYKTSKEVFVADGVILRQVRGGASVVEIDSDIDEEEEEEEEEDEEEEESTLVSSTVKATSKAKVKKTLAAKSAVNVGLADSTPAKKSAKKTAKKQSKMSFKVPYIVKACLNPFTVLAMTKAYFGSLFNLNYIKEDPSQDLRSALEEKAKKAGGSNKPRRKMKPGQAKTLSDLPQLNT